MNPWSSSSDSSAISVAGRASLTVTRAPCAFKNRAAANPLFPNPTTNTRLFFSSNMQPRLARSILYALRYLRLYLNCNVGRYTDIITTVAAGLLER